MHQGPIDALRAHRDNGRGPRDDLPPLHPVVGWRLVAALTALAAVACGITLVLVALVPEPGAPGAARLRVRTSPWAACARAVRHQLADPPGVEVHGPTRTRWDATGAGVDMSGRTTGGAVKDAGFGCHAIRLGDDWQVERLVFADR